jgi:GNAT superfamily N-acetyltransferase
MIEITRTTGADPRSLALRTAMDHETFGMYEAEFAAMDEAVRTRLSTALATDQADLIEVVIASENGADLGHAALRALPSGGYEVKKVYVVPEARGRGISRLLMTAVEDVAREMGESRILLQTGLKQREAIALYESTGYEHVEAFAPYDGLENLVFMAKALA